MSIRLSVLILAAAVLWIGMAGSAQATPDSGACGSCHGGTANKNRPGAMDLTGSISPLAVPGRLDGGTASPLPMYSVEPGGTVTFSFNVKDGRNKYSLGLFDLEAGGVKNNASNLLTFTADPDWILRTDPDTSLPYYSLDIKTWGGTATTYDFTMTVGAGTPLDVYALQAVAAGRGPGTTSGTVQWGDFEPFYLNVVSSPVPEPSALVGLAGFGAVGLVWWSRRRRQNR